MENKYIICDYYICDMITKDIIRYCSNFKIVKNEYNIKIVC